MAATEPTRKRTWRARGVVRELILTAARELFSERGYAGTATREIAARAEVSEVLLFRHFKSKAQLFEEAVFEPMDRFIREFQALHLQRGDAAPGSVHETKDFVTGLQQWLLRNRHLLMALITAEHYQKDVRASLKDSLALKDYFKTAERYLEPNASEYRVELPLGVRLSFATALAVVLFQDWLFADVRRSVSKQKFVDQLSLYMLGGLQGSAETKKSARTKRATAKSKTRGRRAS